MPSNPRTLEVDLTPVLKECPRCSSTMRRDYRNRRTLHGASGTTVLTLVVLRCQSKSCPRFHRPYRPEFEWHYGLPGTKFDLTASRLVFERHLAGESNLAIHRSITTLGVPSSPRSVKNIVDRYKELTRRASAAWTKLQLASLKSERQVFLDLLPLHEHKERLYVLARDCFSNCVLGGLEILKEDMHDDATAFLHSILDRLPVPVTYICRPRIAGLREATTRLLPGVYVFNPRVLSPSAAR